MPGKPQPTPQTLKTVTLSCSILSTSNGRTSWLFKMMYTYYIYYIL